MKRSVLRHIYKIWCRLVPDTVCMLNHTVSKECCLIFKGHSRSVVNITVTFLVIAIGS